METRGGTAAVYQYEIKHGLVYLYVNGMLTGMYQDGVVMQDWLYRHPEYINRYGD